jgi:branched-subunit amino acid ABC-type transport system permease component
MTGGYMLLAQVRDNTDRVLNEGLVTAASIALIAASILWVIVSRLVVRNLRKKARITTGSLKTGKAAPAAIEEDASLIRTRDIWKKPPGADT